MRLALGASRGRLVRQLLIESLLLAGAGGVARAGPACWLSRRWSAASPPIRRAAAIDDDARPARAGVHAACHAPDRASCSASCRRCRARASCRAGACKEERAASPAGHVRARKALVAAAGRLWRRAADRRRPVRPHARQSPAGRPRVQHRARGDVRASVRRRSTTCPEARVPDAARRAGRVSGVRAAGAIDARLLTGGRMGQPDHAAGCGARAMAAGRGAISTPSRPATSRRWACRSGSDAASTWNDWGSTARSPSSTRRSSISTCRTRCRRTADGAGPRSAPDIEIIGMLANARYDASAARCRARRSSRWAASGWRW